MFIPYLSNAFNIENKDLENIENIETFNIENIENKDLENLTLQILKKIDISHWVKTQRSKIVIIKLFRRKDASKIRSEKKKLMGENLTSLGISTPVYINDSLCIYYKKLWAKCKKLHNNKLIYFVNRIYLKIILRITEKFCFIVFCCCCCCGCC